MDQLEKTTKDLRETIRVLGEFIAQVGLPPEKTKELMAIHLSLIQILEDLRSAANTVGTIEKIIKGEMQNVV